MKRFLILWFVCCALCCARRPDLVFAPQFYAEDGAVFFVNAVTTGLQSMFSVYAGYHHVLAQLISIAALVFPVAVQPSVYAWTTIALEALCCALLMPLLRSLIRDEPSRWMIAIALAAIVPADEVIGSVASLQWYLALPMIAAALVPLNGRAANAARVLAVLVGATTPQGIIAAPIAMYAWWKKPSGVDPWIATLYAFTSFLNVATASSGMNPHPASPLLQALFTVPAFRVADTLLLGKPAAVFLAGLPLLGVSIGVAALMAALVALARVRGAATAWTMAYVMLSPIILVLLTRPLLETAFFGYGFFGADRYFVSACGALVVVLGLIVSAAAQAQTARKVLACLLVIGIVLDLREPNVPPDEHWQASVPAINRWVAARDEARPTPVVTVPIPPASWSMTLRSCSAGSSGGLFPKCP